MDKGELQDKQDNFKMDMYPSIDPELCGEVWAEFDAFAIFLFAKKEKHLEVNELTWCPRGSKVPP